MLICILVILICSYIMGLITLWNYDYFIADFLGYKYPQLISNEDSPKIIASIKFIPIINFIMCIILINSEIPDK